MKRKTNNQRIADCILTEHNYLHERDIFFNLSIRDADPSGKTYRIVCAHCGAYAVHPAGDGDWGDSPTTIVPIHRGPDRRMAAYWEKQSAKQRQELEIKKQLKKTKKRVLEDFEIEI